MEPKIAFALVLATMGSGRESQPPIIEVHREVPRIRDVDEHLMDYEKAPPYSSQEKTRENPTEDAVQMAYCSRAPKCGCGCQEGIQCECAAKVRRKIAEFNAKVYSSAEPDRLSSAESKLSSAQAQLSGTAEWWVRPRRGAESPPSVPPSAEIMGGEIVSGFHLGPPMGTHPPMDFIRSIGIPTNRASIGPALNKKDC